MSLRTFISTFLLVVGMSPAGIFADSGTDVFAPELPPVEEFSTIWERSPFIVETKAVEDSAGLAAKYALTGIAEVAGKPVVFLRDKRSLLPLTVVAGEPNGEGLEVVSIVVNEDARNSAVTIRQGTEQASLSFDPSVFQVSAHMAIPQPTADASTTPATEPQIVRPLQGTAPQTPPMRPTGAAVPPPPNNGNPAPTPPNAAKRIIRPPVNIQK